MLTQQQQHAPLYVKTLNKSALSINNSFITSVAHTQHIVNPSISSSIITNNNENSITVYPHPQTKTKLFARITDTTHRNNIVPKKLSISTFNLKSLSSRGSSCSSSSSHLPSISCYDTKQNNSCSLGNNNNNNTSSYYDNNNNNNSINDASLSSSHLTLIEKVFNDIAKIKQYTSLSLKRLKKSKSTLTLKHIQQSTPTKDQNDSLRESLSLKSISLKQQQQHHSSSLTLHHTRSFDLPLTEIQKNAFTIYSVPSFLKQSQLSHTSPTIQLSTIIDKSLLILDNITYFKSTYMFSGNFQRAFRNLTLHQKATFNKTIEDTCSLLMKLPPLLMKHIYDSLDQILYCAIPNLHDESKKRISNEDECMKENYKVFIEVTNYYMGCVEVFKIITKKIRGMKYNRNTYCNISLLLDTARYNTSSLNAFANTYIDKMKEDLKLLNKLEENLHLKKKNKSCNSSSSNSNKNDYLERCRDKDKQQKLMRENEKRNRITAALNMENKERKNINDYNNNSSSSCNRSNCSNNHNSKKYYLQKSLLNLNVITELMNYIDKPIRERIIAQRVVERYKENELTTKRLQMDNSKHKQ